MDLAESYASVRPGIVAFAPRFVPPGRTHFEYVFGTGFIIDDSLVATNAHVVDEIRKHRTDDGKDLAAVAIAFVRQPQGWSTVLLNVTATSQITSVKARDFYYGPPRADLGLAVVHCTGLSSTALELDPEFVPEGAPVATAGFPMGRQLMHLEGRLDHVAPTLQAGVLGARLPFPDATPHGYLINVMIQGGASGSPVFHPSTGGVLGIVYASRLAQIMGERTDGLYQLINFAHVVPTYYLYPLIDDAKRNMQELPDAGDRPTLDEIVASLPKTPVEQITTGVYRREPTG